MQKCKDQSFSGANAFEAPHFVSSGSIAPIFNIRSMFLFSNSGALSPAVYGVQCTCPIFPDANSMRCFATLTSSRWPSQMDSNFFIISMNLFWYGWSLGRSGPPFFSYVPFSLRLLVHPSDDAQFASPDLLLPWSARFLPPMSVSSFRFVHAPGCTLRHLYTKQFTCAYEVEQASSRNSSQMFDMGRLRKPNV